VLEFDTGSHIVAAEANHSVLSNSLARATREFLALLDNGIYSGAYSNGSSDAGCSIAGGVLCSFGRDPELRNNDFDNVARTCIDRCDDRMFILARFLQGVKLAIE
jgi:hypothetical protein